MADKDLQINALYEVIQKYECTNRITKAKIRMTRIKFLIDNKPAGIGTYVTCETHKETRHCKNKTEAVFQMRQPWVWCDECSQIHFNSEWQQSLINHGNEDKNYD